MRKPKKISHFARQNAEKSGRKRNPGATEVSREPRYRKQRDHPQPMSLDHGIEKPQTTLTLVFPVVPIPGAPKTMLSALARLEVHLRLAGRGLAKKRPDGSEPLRSASRQSIRQSVKWLAHGPRISRLLCCVSSTT